MHIITDKTSLRQWVARCKQSGEPINFVPTMGNLHAGHMSLVSQAKNMPGKTAVSIFINPLQFDCEDDLRAYPRTWENDVRLLERYQVDMLFYPQVQEIYGNDQEQVTRISVPQLSTRLEGASRPGHFDGVSTIVCKLFHLLQPDHAIFGEKDYQQLLIIKKMARDLDMPVQIHAHPLVREDDGLAMSSRNNRLGKQARALAPALYQALLRIKTELDKGAHDYARVQQQAAEWLNQQCCQQDGQQICFHSDYLLIANQRDLTPASPDCREKIILGAAFLQDIRLIDNIMLYY